MDETIRYALYVATILGAVSLAMMMPRRGGRTTAVFGGILGASTVGGLWLVLAPMLGDLGDQAAPFAYYYVFSALALIAACRVITHTRPVYSALWFVMTVLASAGLLIVLAAEFIAFALVIIYGGAILVTYVFVIMLAAEAGDPGDPDSVPEYDGQAREPIAAAASGFLLLAMLLTLAFGPLAPNPDAAAAPDAQVAQEILPRRDAPGLEGVLNRTDAASLNAAAATIDADAAPQSDGSAVPAVSHAPIENIERVGLELFMAYPLGLELAGVVLLVSLVGAVVIATQRVDPLHEKATGIATPPQGRG